MRQLVNVLSAILVLFAANANAQIDSAENFEASFALSSNMVAGGKSGSFVINNYSQNNEFKCVGGLAAAKKRANELCAGPSSIVGIRRQCIPSAWNPGVNVEILSVGYKCQ